MGLVSDIVVNFLIKERCQKINSVQWKVIKCQRHIRYLLSAVGNSLENAISIFETNTHSYDTFVQPMHSKLSDTDPAQCCTDREIE